MRLTASEGSHSQLSWCGSEFILDENEETLEARVDDEDDENVSWIKLNSIKTRALYLALHAMYEETGK